MQVGTVQVGTAQVGTAQVGTVQVGTAQVGIAQVGTAQVGTAQVGTRAIDIARGPPQRVLCQYSFEFVRGEGFDGSDLLGRIVYIGHRDRTCSTRPTACVETSSRRTNTAVPGTGSRWGSADHCCSRPAM